MLEIIIPYYNDRHAPINEAIIGLEGYVSTEDRIILANIGFH